MAIGRISGPLLKSNLLRDGVDLAFENDLLYLKVTPVRQGNQNSFNDSALPPFEDGDPNYSDSGSNSGPSSAIGIKTDTPQYDLDVNGTIGSVSSFFGFLQVDDVIINDSTITTELYDLTISAAETRKVLFNRSVDIDGDLYVTGNIRADGTLTLGDSTTDDIIFNADINSNIIPNITDIFNIGSALKRWNELYTVKAEIGNIAIDGNSITALNSNGDIIIDANAAGSVIINNVLEVTPTNVILADTEIQSAAVLNLVPGRVVLAGPNSAIVDSADLTFEDGELGVGADVVPKLDGIYDIGTSTFKWRNFYVDNMISTSSLVGGDLTVTGDGYFDGNVTVGADDSATATLLTNAETFNLINDTAITVNFAGAATDINIGAYTGTTTVNNQLVVLDGIVVGSVEVFDAYGNLLVPVPEADKLTTPREIALDGDVSGFTLFDGSINVSITATLDTVNTNPGTFGSTTSIPVVTVNGKGLVTEITTADIATTLTIVGDDSTEYALSLLNERLMFVGTNPVNITINENEAIISVQDATHTSKGIASFSGDDFTLIDGNVELQYTTVTFGSTVVALGETSPSINDLTQITVGDLQIDNNIIAGTDTNGDIILNPNGTGSIDVSGAKITNLAEPAVASDAATRGYVDNAVSGLTWKNSAQLLANTNVALSGSTGTLIIDSHPALDGGDSGYRILLINQTTPSQNGIYVYNDNSSTYTLTRSTDADTYQELIGAAIFIKEGTVYASTGWVQSNHYITDFTNQDWVQFSGAGAYTAGAGLVVNGTVFSHADTSSVLDLTATSNTFVTGLTFDTFGHVTARTTGVATTYSQSAVTTTGGALLRLAGSDASTDDVKFASGTNVTVAYTDDNTITISANDTDVILGTDTTGNYVATVASVGGSITVTGSGVETAAVNIDLSNTGVVAGSYGSTTAIPVLAIDSQGRITSASTATIATSLRIRGDDSSEDTVDLLNDVLEFIGNGPLQTTVTDDRVSFSIDDATTTTKGVASFSTDDFTVTSGAVTIKNVNLGTQTTGDYVATITGTENQVIISGAGTEGRAVTLTTPQDIATTSSPTFANLSLTGDLRGPATFTIDPATVGDNTGTVVIKGNLQVDGTTTTINSTVTTVDDPVITLGGDTAPTTDDNKDRGVEFRWNNGTSAKLGFFGFDDSTGKFTFIPDATNTSEVFSGSKGEVDVNIDWTNILNLPDPTITIAGDVDGSATMTDLGSVTVNVTLDTVNPTVGTYGSATAIPVITADGKGRITNITTAAIATSLRVRGDDSTEDTVDLLNDVLEFIGNGPLQTTVTDDRVSFSIDDATTTTKGVASFSTDNFTVVSGAVATKNITLGTSTLTLGSTTTALAGLTQLDIDNLRLDGNTISSTNTNGDILITPNGTGSVIIDGINIAAFDEHTFYVSDDIGNDSNDGHRVQTPFKTIKYALTQVTAGDTILLLPGTFTEVFPLTVPIGVTVKGSGLRASQVKPTVGTNNKDCFLLNGAVTIEDLTVRDMLYDSINDTGYAFRFAPGAVIAERSPYVQRVTVLNKGSVTTSTDPYGFNQGDAGRGALVDGSQVTRGSLESAMLFNECTLIVPNSRGLIITNGGRVEWLTCFTYFADLAIEGKVGLTGRGGDGKTLLEFGGISGSGFQVGETIQISETDDSTVVNLVIDSIVGDYIYIDGKIDSLEGIDFTPKNGAGIVGLTSGTTATSISRYDRAEFAAEMRAIAGANIYGNQGVKADGDDVTIQLMAHNFAYIGTQADLTNNKAGVVQANEVIEINGGRVYYNSVDQNGNFRVGDLFNVNFETGEVSFEAPTFNISSLSGITFTDGTSTTIVNPTGVTTGNLVLAGNTISTITGPIILDPSGSAQIQFNGEAIFTQPAVISNLQVSDLTAGRVVLAGTSGELQDSANLTFNGTTLNVGGNIDVTGDVTIGGNIIIGNQTVDTITVIADFTSNLVPDTTNTYDLGTDAKRWRTVNAVEFNNDAIKILGNTISTTESNANLQLDPSGTGNIDVSSTKIINLATPLDGTDAANKDYVDSAVSAVVATLTIDADAGTPDTVTLGVDTFTISGTAGEIATAVTNNTVTISLVETGVAATTYGSATAIPVITVNANGQLTNVTTANIATSLRIRGDDSTEDTVDLLNDVLEFIGNGPLQTTVTDDRITFSIDDATTTTKGVASFDTNYFTVTTGAVTLADANNDAGTYGSATAIPIITINAKGQVTDISTATISSSFFVAADAGQEIFSTGNTLTVAGGIGLSTTVTDDSSQTVVTVNLDNTTVIAGSYGSSSKIATFTVDAQGRITTAGEQNIATTLSIVGNSGADTVSLITDSLTFTGTAPIVTAVTDNTVTISAADATTTTKGVASFSTDNFAVAAGVVTIKDGGIANAELANAAVTFGTTTVTLGSTSLILEGLDRLNVDNIEIINNEIRSTNTNGDISLNPNGTGSVAVNSAKITGLADPENDQDAATKFYVDNAISGLTWKNSAQLLANTNVALSGSTGTLIIDGHPALEGGDDGYRILLINQTTPSENGIYVYSDDSSTYTLTRAADADTYQELIGAAVFIKEGDIYANTGWVQSNHYLTDFNNQSWVQFSGAGAYTAGAGLSANGTEFNVNVATNGGIEIVSDNLQLKHTVAGDGLTITNGVLDIGGTTDRITVSANNVDIASTYVGQSSITTLGTITTGTWNGNIIPVDHGGTGTATGSITGIGNLTFTTETTNGSIILIPNGTGVVSVAGPLEADNIKINGGYVSFTTTPSGDEKTIVRALAPAAITTNTATTIDSWDAAEYRTAKYVIQVTQGSKYQSSEVLVVHNGTSVSYTEYAVVETNLLNPIPITIDYAVSGGDVVVTATITDAASTNAEVLILRTLFAIA